MAKVVSYTPEWLTRPSPGFDFLTTTAASDQQCLAHYGTQVFFASGSELRWADLTLFESSHDAEDDIQTSRGWRNLKIPVTRRIERLSVSPDGRYLAVATSHTCHICIIPPTSHLRSTDETALRTKAFQLGPTAHVLEQSPIASILWHPLSAPGSQSLVTVTNDACVRLWELDVNSRSSFDQAALAVDLKKLANATSTTIDVTTNRFGVNRTFSPDDVEMEVAAACFGGQGAPYEHGWASMTLWFSMTEGDVYALCPFLPSSFVLQSHTLASLSTEVIAAAQVITVDTGASEAEKRQSNDQKLWVTSLDGQEPLTVAEEDAQRTCDIYTRPAQPGPIAKLQGPFQLSSEPSNMSITDIHVVAPSTNEAYLFDEADDIVEDAGASISIVCLATDHGQVHITAVLAAVTALWLPHKRSRAISLDDEDEANELLVLHSADVKTGPRCALTFTPSLDRYEVFVSSSSGVYQLDFNPWIHTLEEELNGEGTSGTDFRLEMMLESAPSTMRSILEIDQNVTTAVVIDRSDFASLVLTAGTTGPHAAMLEAPHYAHPFEPELLALSAPELRESYQPSPAFFQASDIASMVAAKTRGNAVAKSELGSKIRAKPDTLQLLTDMHRLLSQETHRLGVAAANLFRRCDRMRMELADQVEKVNEISEKTTAITSAGGDLDAEAGTGETSEVDAVISGRILQIQSNADNMEERIKNLRSNILRLGGEDLSIKERAYLREVEQLQAQIGASRISGSVEAPTTPSSIVHLPDHESARSPQVNGHVSSTTFDTRLQRIEKLKEDLIDEANDATTEQSQQHVSEQRPASTATLEYRRQKLAHVMDLLERETALIDAVTGRLGRISGPE